MSFCIDNEKLLEKYEANWSEIENLRNNELNALLLYDDRYIKTKIRTFGDKVCSNFLGINATKDDTECEFFTVISIEFLLVCKNKYYLQVYLDNCAYKISNIQMIDYLDKNLFED